MRLFLRRLFHNRKGFTLLECVLATAILGAGAVMVMGMVSAGYGFIGRSRSLDNIAAVAQEEILLYYDGEVVDQLTEVSDYRYGFSPDLKARVSFEVYYGSTGSTVDVIAPSTFNFVAVIVTDNMDNKVVYYEVSPSDERIQKLYIR